MRYFFTALFLLHLAVNAQESLHQKYPANLLTQDEYGILSEADIIYDLKKANSKETDIKKMRPGYYRWQCFPIKDVKYSYSTWRDNDPKGPSDEIVTLCSYSIQAKGKKLNHFYYDGTARNVYYCRLLRREWRNLTAGQSHICLHGGDGSLDSGEKVWTWNKIKTKNGCTSLFSGDCDTDRAFN